MLKSNSIEIFCTVTHTDKKVQQRRISSGGAYVGSGYDILRGNPYGDTPGSSGIDPGLRPSRFILEKTFSNPDSPCPDQATCTDLEGSTESYHARLQLDMVDYQSSFHEAWGAGLGGGISYANFGGSLSDGFKNVKRRLEREQTVLIDNQTTQIYSEASFNYNSQGFLTAEFLAHACQLPTQYSASKYLAFIRDWGTHVILRTRMGTRNLFRMAYSGRTITNYLLQNTENCVSASATAMSFFSGHLSHDSSASVMTDIQRETQAIDYISVASGSKTNPVPITLRLESIDNFLSGKYIKQETLDGLLHLSCGQLRDPEVLCRIKANVARALAEYPLVDGATEPEPIWRNYTLSKPVEKVILFE